MKSLKVLAAGAVIAGVAAVGTAQASDTVNAIKAKDFIQCGSNVGLPGFSAPNDQGEWTGLDVDFCKALAAAILGDANKVRFTPLSAQQRFTALQSGEIDVLTRNTTFTLSRDTNLGLNFIGINFYDGQGFLVANSLGVSSAKELDGATICVEPGTTTELNLADYFRANGMSFEPVVIENITEATGAFFSGRCDAITTDSSGLASIRATQAPNPDDYDILPEIISKEPLGPVVRHGDEQFTDIVRWVYMAMLEAEEKGVTSQNVDEMLKSEDPVIKRLLGTSPGMGEALGLDEQWAYRVIAQVGNYGESYARTVTAIVGLPRGYNDLWTNGGLMYAAPLR